MIVKPSIRTGFELESVLSAAEAVARRVALKQRDARLEAMVLVLADTRANRAAVAAARATLQGAFPTNARAVLAELRAGRSPQGNGILLV
ncbi:MAG TPA: hypothetical protein VHK28_01540 [Candidatus Limnocylindria bacterium]|nr:hypothetical protein [Candidatus Limnocylindria bacterium]